MDHSQHHILCIGLNHQTAGVAFREQLAFSPHQLDASLARLGCGTNGHPGPIRELVILSTCNRVELYAVTETPEFSTLESFLAEIKNQSIETFQPALYRLQDLDAARHLMRVACGLDSVVLGEPQILGQVTDAYSTARRHSTAGKLLSRLFQSAIQAGKRARTETGISHSAASIASVAVRLISRTVSDLRHARVMVLGAGEMAELAVEALRKRGAEHIVVVNRTRERAQELAQRWNGHSASLEHLSEFLEEADIVITSTGAPHTVIRAPMIAEVMTARPERPLVLMDIAVPRDVDTTAGEIPGVHLYDMDTLATHLKDSLSRRQAEIPRVEAIVNEELARFTEFLTSLDVVPLIVQLRARADAIRRAELERTLRRIPDAGEETEQHLDALTRAIVNKILHEPTTRLRAEAGGPKALDYADLTRALFGLE